MPFNEKGGKKEKRGKDECSVRYWGGGASPFNRKRATESQPQPKETLPQRGKPYSRKERRGHSRERKNQDRNYFHVGGRRKKVLSISSRKRTKKPNFGGAEGSFVLSGGQ